MQKMSERSPDGVSRKRLLRGVQSSSEKSPVPWTTMSWLKLNEASLLQSIEEEQLRLSQVPRSDAGYELSQLASRVTSAMHAESSNGDDPFAKVKSLISEVIARLEEEASADATHKRIVTGMLDAVESELPGHVEETEFQVSFSVIDARRQSSNSQRKWTAAA